MKSECKLCKGVATDTHHIFSGSNRKRADKLGMVVRLCRPCHMRLHANPKGEWLDLKKEAQREFEKTHSREEFIRIIGRNYL